MSSGAMSDESVEITFRAHLHAEGDTDLPACGDSWTARGRGVVCILHTGHGGMHDSGSMMWSEPIGESDPWWKFW